MKVNGCNTITHDMMNNNGSEILDNITSIFFPWSPIILIFIFLEVDVELGDIALCSQPALKLKAAARLFRGDFVLPQREQADPTAASHGREWRRGAAPPLTLRQWKV